MDAPPVSMPYEVALERPEAGDEAGLRTQRLPSENEWTERSLATLQALEQASRAIGRMEGAHRDVSPSIAGVFATIAIEAMASAAIGGGEPSWTKSRALFVEARHPRTAGTVNGRSALLMRQLLELERSSARTHAPHTHARYRDVLYAWPHSVDCHAAVPMPRARDIALDLAAWVPDSAEPALLKAALAMMAVAAEDPDSVDNGVTARMLFAQVLEAARGARDWCAPPVSWGLRSDKSLWPRVSRVLIGDSAPDAHELDDALRDIFLAVAHSATAAAFAVEQAGQMSIAQSGGRWAKDLTPSQRVLLDALIGLPGVTTEQASRLLPLTPRGTKGAMAALVVAGLAVPRTSRTGTEYFVAKRGHRPWLQAIGYYPLPGKPDATTP